MRSFIKYLLYLVNHFIVFVAEQIRIYFKINKKQSIKSKFDSAYSALSELDAEHVEVEYERVLIDGMWYNPNYWFRFGLLKSALGLSNAKLYGVYGKYNKGKTSKIFNHFRINQTYMFFPKYSEYYKAHQLAKEIITNTHHVDDILEWKLPNNFPAEIVYDGMQVRQRSAYVNISDKKNIDYLTEAIASIYVAERIIDAVKPELLLMSHAIQFSYGSLVWSAILRGIPVIVMYGDHGVFRFWKIRNKKERRMSEDSPTINDIKSLNSSKKTELKKIGEKYIRDRINGKAEDLGSYYAYTHASGDIDRDAILERYNWDADKPIVCIYAHCWFDYPHGATMEVFRDFHDWIITTYENVANIENINWLFKSHPSDQYYGGITLNEIVSSEKYKHIKIVPISWNNASVMKSIDAVVTHQSTIGMEAACIGLPVLTAERVWYSDAEFVRSASTKEEYLALLRTRWWESTCLETAKNNALIFVGWRFGMPDWQNGLIMEDDSKIDDLYVSINKFLRDESQVIYKEIKCMNEWYFSKEQHYQIYKMANSN